VSGVQVSELGKAVSVSSRGDEIRIWELEDVLSSHPTSRKSLHLDGSIRINVGQPQRRKSLNLNIVSEAIERTDSGCGLVVDEVSREPARMGDWVGFDEERVIVLREQGLRTQLLACYDFT
jgi:hypothetical protein